IAIRRPGGGARISFRNRTDAIEHLREMFGPEATINPEEIRADLRNRFAARKKALRAMFAELESLKSMHDARAIDRNEYTKSIRKEMERMMGGKETYLDVLRKERDFAGMERSESDSNEGIGYEDWNRMLGVTA